MPIELTVPEAGESITEVEVGEWLKSEGEAVALDAPLVVLETDKAAMELPSPVAGTLVSIARQTGDAVKPGDVIGYLEEGEVEAPTSSATPQPGASPAIEAKQSAAVTPAARRLLTEHGLQGEDVQGSGSGGRVLKEDVIRHVAVQPEESAGTADEPADQPSTTDGREEEVVRMSLLRRKVAQRLVEAQQTAALLTTFNEIDMSSVIALRKDQQPQFQERHGVKLGFMSFFVKASIDALKLIPQLNAEVRGDNVVYRNYYDVGVAVGSERGLVVPVLRNADRMSFAETEAVIADFAQRAGEGTLTVEELQGGTFTLSNGGIYGSLLSTPIVNPPQSGVLGMHAIQDRPVAVEGEVVIRPMMYVALTYDHRIVDGKQAVTFLKRVKECVETPARMLLEA